MQRFRKTSLFRPAFLIIGLMLMFTLAACRPPPAPIASSDSESAPAATPEEAIAAPTDTPEPVDTPTPIVDVERISVEDTKALFDAGEAVIVDVRTSVEYERGHIPGAIAIPRSEIESRMEELPHEAEILLYCT